MSKLIAYVPDGNEVRIRPAPVDATGWTTLRPALRLSLLTAEHRQSHRLGDSVPLGIFLAWDGFGTGRRCILRPNLGTRPPDR